MVCVCRTMGNEANLRSPVEPEHFLDLEHDSIIVLLNTERSTGAGGLG